MWVKALRLKETQCCTAAFFFPKSGWLLSCTFSNPSRSKKVSQATFQVFNPHVCFPERFCLCCWRAHLVFWGTRERWLLLSFSFAEAVCCIGRCDFYMRASKVGGLVYMQKNHKIKVYCSESSSETETSLFLVVFVLFSPHFFFPWDLTSYHGVQF